MMPSLWQSDLGFGAPAFTSRLPPFHPISLFVHLLGIDSPMWITVLAIALAALGAISTFWAARRRHWIELTLIATLALLGMSATFMAAFVVALLITQRSIKVLAALVTALLLTAWWWLPALAMWQWQAGPARPVPEVRNVHSSDGVWRSIEGRPQPDALFNSRFLDDVKPLVIRGNDWAYDSPFFDFLNIRFVDGKQNPDALPRWFLARSFVVEADPAGPNLRNITSFRDLATVNHLPAKMVTLSNSAIVAVTPWTVVKLGGGQVDPSLRVTSNGWNLLVSSVPWWPGWRVYWNGERMPPVTVNGAFLGAFIPPGAGRFVVRYRPNEFDAGLRWAAIGLLLLIAGAFWPWYERVAETARRIGDRSRAYAQAFLAVRSDVPVRRTLLVLTGVYAIAVMTLSGHYAGGADSSGYANYARLLRTGQSLVVPLHTLRELDLPDDLARTFVPLGFSWGGRQTMVPVYPPGLPLHMAALGLIGGERAGFLAAPLGATVAVVMMYLLARALGFGVGRAAAASAILISCATFSLFAVQPISDDVATAWSLIVLYFALRGSNSTTLAALAGAAFGIGVLVRPTQILLLPAALILIGLRWRSLIAFGLGGLPLAIVQGVVSYRLYGSPFLTSYGDMSTAFALANVPVRLHHYSYWFLILLTPAIFPLGLIGAWTKWASARIRAALVVCFASFFLFYCFYEPYKEWWSTRFILPGVPALILLALGGARSIWEARKWSTLSAAALLLVVLARQNFVTWNFQVWESGPAEKIYPIAINATRLEMPRDAVLVAMQASGAYYYYTRDLAIRWDLIDTNQFKTYIESLPREVYALIWDFEARQFLDRTQASWITIRRFPEGVTLFRLARCQVIDRDAGKRSHAQQ